MEGLRNLSPRRLEKLLLDCRSVKVKRLFFFFGDRHQHGWLKHIEKRLIDLGEGKRMLERAGKLDAKYPDYRSERSLMAFADEYARHAGLLLRCLPHVAKEDCFAIKGGTAINLSAPR